MAQTNKTSRIIDLDRVKQNHLVEEVISSQSESIFRNEYEQAARVIRNIIECNSLHDNSYSQNLTKYQTAVPFIGDRGTGKTSVMFSVLRALEHNPSDLFGLLEKEEADVCTNARFICFQMIDIDSVKSNEKILEIILSRMLHYLKRLEHESGSNGYRGPERSSSYQDYRRNAPEYCEGKRNGIRKGTIEMTDIYKSFDELYRMLCQLKDNSKPEPFEQGLAGLNNVVDTQMVISRFRRLVQDYTEAVQYLNGWKERCYLVFAMDDIDLFPGTKEHPKFTLLEQIYDYLRIPNVIVLITFNERLINLICMNHYQDMFFPNACTATLSMEKNAELSKLTSQFMTKLFPPEQRVYMPEFTYVNSKGQTSLYVYPVLMNNNQLVKPFTARTREVTVKEFILRVIAHRTSVYFDINGTKKHFLEPRNLREFGTMVQMFLRWQDPKGDKDCIAANRQRLLEYMRNQFAGTYLSSAEQYSFQQLSSLPLIRQERKLVDEIRNARSQNEADRWKYSYGELIQNLYHSTRTYILSGNSDSTILSKEYVQCILGTHTIMLNQMQDANDMMGIQMYAGSSIAGRWANSMLPKYAVEGLIPYSLGSVSTTLKNYLGFNLPEDVIDLMTYGGEHDSWKTPFTLFTKALAFLGMFFTSLPASGLKISILPEINASLTEDNSSATLSFRLLSNSEDQVCFNVLNPILNNMVFVNPDDMQIGSFTEYFHRKLQKLSEHFQEKVQSYCCNALESVEVELADLDRRLNFAHRYEESRLQEQKPYLENKYRKYQRLVQMMGSLESKESGLHVFETEWAKAVQASKTYYANKKKQKTGLPLAQVDMMYNILKRMASVSYHDIPAEAPIEDSFDYLVRLYRGIAGELELQDKVYGSDFAENFRESLPYRILSADETSPNYNPYVKSLFIEMMKCTHNRVIHRDSVGRITPSSEGNPTRLLPPK